MLDQPGIQLDELLDQWEQAWASGSDVSAAELCAESPELEHLLESRIRILKAMDWVDEVSRADHESTSAVASSTIQYLPSISAEKLARAIVDNGLMTESEIRELRGSPTAASGLQLGMLLVEQRNLTEYQLRALCSESRLPLVIGDYNILGECGAGGMGLVYRAKHRHMQRVVALKVLPNELLNSESRRRRFEREIEVAAKLDHPNIVTSYDAGVDAQGQRYLVMQYIVGRDLATHVAAQGPLPWAEAINYIVQTAHGLQYAHAHEPAIVHRDIKPANLMLDEFGSVKILDLGLASVKDGVTAKDSQLTGTGTLLGTAEYLAPEQAFDSRTADHRADIYSLGCTLCYLLTGKPPFTGDTLMKLLLAHREHNIPSLCSLVPDSPPALDDVFARMMAKTPADRYQKIAELVDDLEHLCDRKTTGIQERCPPQKESPETLRARPLPTWQNLRSNRFALTAIGTIVLACAVTMAVVLQDYQEPMAQNPADAAVGPLALVSNPTPIEGLRSWSVETQYHRGTVFDMAYSPDGRFLATGGADGSIRIWSADSFELQRIQKIHKGPVRDVAWSRDSRFVASSTGEESILIWNVASGTVESSIAIDSKGAKNLAWSPDGRHIAFESDDTDRSIVAVLDAETGEKVTTFPGCTRPTWLSDGASLGLFRRKPLAFETRGMADGTVRLRHECAPPLVLSDLGLSGDGGTLAMSTENAIDLIDTETGRVKHSFPKPTEDVAFVSLSPDGTQVLTRQGVDYQLSRVADGKVIQAFKGQLTNPCWSSDGQNIASWSVPVESRFDDLRVFSVSEQHPGTYRISFGKATYSGDNGVTLKAGPWSPDGQHLLASTFRGVNVFDARSGQLQARLQCRSGQPGGTLFWSTDGDRVFTSVSSSGSRVTGVSSTPLINPVETQLIHREAGLLLSFSDDGKVIAFKNKSDVRIFDAGTDELLSEFEIHEYAEQPGHSSTILIGQLSHDGSSLATTGFPQGEVVHFWDVKTGQLKFPRDCGSNVRMIRWSGDSRRVATCNEHGLIHVWDSTSGSPVASTRNEADRYVDLSWSPRSEILALVTESGSIRYWEPGKKSFGRSSLINTLGIGAPIWSSDGRSYACLTGLGTIQIHSSDSDSRLGTILVLPDGAVYVIGSNGHYRGYSSQQVPDESLVYVAETADGEQQLFTRQEFAQTFDWFNDPIGVSLVPGQTEPDQEMDGATTSP